MSCIDDLAFGTAPQARINKSVRDRIDKALAECVRAENKACWTGVTHGFCMLAAPVAVFSFLITWFMYVSVVTVREVDGRLAGWLGLNLAAAVILFTVLFLGALVVIIRQAAVTLAVIDRRVDLSGESTTTLRGRVTSMLDEPEIAVLGDMHHGRCGPCWWLATPTEEKIDALYYAHIKDVAFAALKEEEQVRVLTLAALHQCLLKSV